MHNNLTSKVRKDFNMGIFNHNFLKANPVYV